jgi:hypothetical protein
LGRELIAGRFRRPDREKITMSSPTGTARTRRIDTTMMYAVHRAFERDLDSLTSLAGRGLAADPAARAGWDRFKLYLHIHHTAEDTHLWPVLEARLADRPDGLRVLQTMEREHAGLTALLDSVEATLSGPVSSAEVLVQARLLGQALGTHCRDEEEQALPLVVALLSAEEWEAFGAEQRRPLGLRGAASFFPWLLDEATDETRQTVLGYLPPPVRLLYRILWRPRYLRGPRWEELARD